MPTRRETPSPHHVAQANQTVDPMVLLQGFMAAFSAMNNPSPAPCTCCEGHRYPESHGVMVHPHPAPAAAPAAAPVAAPAAVLGLPEVHPLSQAHHDERVRRAERAAKAVAAADEAAKAKAAAAAAALAAMPCRDRSSEDLRYNDVRHSDTRCLDDSDCKDPMCTHAHSIGAMRHRNFWTVMCGCMDEDWKCTRDVRCWYAHTEEQFQCGKEMQLGIQANAAQAAEAAKSDSRYKTAPCKHFAATGSCHFGDACRFAHGDGDLCTPLRHRLYKTMPCWTFVATGECPYGDRCTFIHPVTSEERVAGLVDNRPKFCSEANCDRTTCPNVHSSTLVTYPGQ